MAVLEVVKWGPKDQKQLAHTFCLAYIVLFGNVN